MSEDKEKKGAELDPEDIDWDAVDRMYGEDGEYTEPQDGVDDFGEEETEEDEGGIDLGFDENDDRILDKIAEDGKPKAALERANKSLKKILKRYHG
jgi:hypothetical protein